MKIFLTIIALLILTAPSSATVMAQTFELDYSTYLGGNDYIDSGKAVAVDSNYNIIVAGYTGSDNFPTENPYQSTEGGGTYDAFLSAISSSGSTLIYSTYLGGSGSDSCTSLAVDSLNRPYLSGYTLSEDFPTKNPFQASRQNFAHEAFVTRFTSTGAALSYSTYLGGSGTDMGWGIKVSSGYLAHLTGQTSSTDFPTKNPYQSTSAGNEDIYLTILSPSGSALIYSTYLGGGERDVGECIALDSDKRVYLSGWTESTDFPLLNPYQSTRGGDEYDYDIFFTAFTFLGESLRYSTYLGGAGDDIASSINLTTDNQAWLSGWTSSTDFPLANPYQSGYGGGDWDIFVSRFSSTGSSLNYSSYLGGSKSDTGESMDLDSFNSPCLTGYTKSEDFPTINPYQSSLSGGFDDQDAFLLRLSSSGSSLTYSTYLGGDGSDSGMSITIDDMDRAYLTGKTGSENFPTLDPYQASLAGNYSYAFISRFQLITPTPTPIGFHTPTPTITPEPTASPTITPSPSTTPTASPTITPSPSTTPTAAPTSSPSPSTTPTAEPTASPSATLSVALTPTPHDPLPIIDFNGDGTTGIGIFRESSGLWAIRQITRVYFGSITDEIIPGDYDGDGTTDIGIFRPSTGLWAIRDISRVYFGSSSDQPVQGDYNGNGTTIPGIFRKTSGLWAIRGLTRIYFGSTTDHPVSGDYDGDRTSDIGIFRESSGLWAIRQITRIYFGSSFDQTVPGDYNGSEIWTPGIFRPASGLWAIRGTTRIYFGGSSDKTVPGDYTGDQTDDIGIFRESSGLWAVRGVTRVYFGSSSDIPITR